MSAPAKPLPSSTFSGESVIKFEIFIKLMQLTTSSFDAEALSALRKANALLMSANNNWEDLLRGKVRMVSGPNENQIAGEQHTGADEIDHMFDGLMRSRLSPSFCEFVEAVHTWWEEKGFLTERQFEAIRDAHSRCGRS